MRAKEKEFDCVKMKREIQRRLQKQLAGLSAAEAERFSLERILSDPALAKMWREAKRHPTSVLAAPRSSRS